jgi:hypothetical protein
MSKVLAQCLFGVALVSTQAFAQTDQPPQTPPARTNQASQPIPANLTRQFSTAMGAIAGRQTTFADWYAIAADCVPLNWYEIIITRAPQHGEAQVVSKDEPISYPDSNPRKTCNGKPIAAKALTYTPDKAYAGADSMAVQKISSNGYLETVTFTITVIQLSENVADKAATPENATDK